MMIKKFIFLINIVSLILLSGCPRFYNPWEETTFKPDSEYTPDPIETLTPHPTEITTPEPTAVPTAVPGGSFVKGINLYGDAVTIEGNAWISYSDALSSGFSTTLDSTYSSSITWSPPADTDTSAMLNKTIYMNQASFIMTQTIDNGNYDVYFWIGENYNDNARSLDIELEGNTVATGIGTMLLNTWVKYGPYNVTVSDGALNMEFVRITLDPHCAGLAIFTSGPTADPTPGPTVEFIETGGLIVMEAENYSQKADGTGTYSSYSWTLNNAEAGASGSEYMEVTPDDGGYANASPDSPVLEYDINISTSGTYYVWVRRIATAGGNDSCCTALNSGPQYEWAYGNASPWEWANSPQTYDINTGTQTFKIYMREDGAKIDKIILTTDSGYTPSGTGPAESGTL
ncbi:MAG: hypothetical protein JXB88_24135 [Spirochaetales bacterium]|nr:hypothetical protein [Spirochaetales bacterium]